MFKKTIKNKIELKLQQVTSTSQTRKRVQVQQLREAGCSKAI